MSPARRATWFAPGRVTLIGDHTDHQGGWVLPFAIELGTTVTVEVNHTSMLTVRSDVFGVAPPVPIDQLGSGSRRSWSRYVAGAVAVLRADGVAIPGAGVAISSSLPVGAGLASSAAVICATIAALTEATGGVIDALTVARRSVRVEHEFGGAEVGFMDPAAVMTGGRGKALLIDTRVGDVDRLPCSLTDLQVLVVDTGATHATSGAGYAERVTQCRAAAAQLSVATLRDVRDLTELTAISDPLLRARARHVVTENQRVLEVAHLVRAGRLREVGAYLLASHRSLRDDFAVSTDRLDQVVGLAMASGALGARLTGAGFGGCAVVLVERERAHAVHDAITTAGSTWGESLPRIWSVSPARGAHSVSQRTGAGI